MLLPRITHKRQFVQGVLIAAALLLPFVTISGNPFLRMDIARMTLFFVGIPLRIDQFYLVLLLILLSVIFFLLLTVVLGRVWCGWLCPQTVFNDLMDLFSRRFSTKASTVSAQLIKHTAALAIATLIALNLFCWFMPPGQVINYPLNYHEHPLLFLSFLLLSLFGYLNLIFVRRSFCASYCPYGRFQAIIVDSGTLNLSFLEETRDMCLHCNACVRSCPMEIDIRAGYQIECIGCGRCIDACRAVMEKKSCGTGLIDYHFGAVKGSRFRPGSLTVILLLVALLLMAGLVWGIVNRSQSAFAVQRISAADARRLADGSQARPWRAIIGNRSESSHVYSIRVGGAAAHNYELLGQVRDITVAPNQHREVMFMIHSVKNSPPAEKIPLQLLSDQQPAVTVTVTP